MKKNVVFLFLIFFLLSGYGQTNSSTLKGDTNPENTKDTSQNISQLKKHGNRKKLIPTSDTLTTSDYVISIERVNDHLNSIRDSIKLEFNLIRTSKRIDEISSDIAIIRKIIRDKQTSINIKNLYLYQSFASNLEEENRQIKSDVYDQYRRVYLAKLRLKTILSDSVFKIVYGDTVLRNRFDEKLDRIERKWARTDSLSKVNIDSLNHLKIKVSDNSITLSNMLNMMDSRLDKAGMQLFNPEVPAIWQFGKPDTLTKIAEKKAVNILGSEQKAIGYYFHQTSGERFIIVVLGILLFIWLSFKLKLLKKLKEKEKDYSFLNLRYLNTRPVFALLTILLCTMPFFDAYAPASYVSGEFFLLVAIAFPVLIQRQQTSFIIDWLLLASLLFADAASYLLLEPTYAARLWLILLHASSLFIFIRLYKNTNENFTFYKWIKKALIIGMVLTLIAILANLTGRLSLAGYFGIAGIIAVAQSFILPVFIDTLVEIVLLQLQSSRIKKGVDKPFESELVVKKIKSPLLVIALLIWVVMLTSNLNIYNSISSFVEDSLTTSRTIGSITFEWISVLWFFMIIWLAHILQRLVGFLFGETGNEQEDDTKVSKGNHSRLLIMRLLVLIGGYLLAIAASGLPIDKLTFLLGALGVGIGMGLQNVVNNFVSGIILIFDGSLQIGDEIEVSGQAGKVKEIGLRSSRLSTSDGAEVIIPNGSILSQNITNWTFSNDQKRVMIWFTINGKELDANMVNETINTTILSLPEVLKQKKPVILYTRVNPDSISLTVRFWSTITHTDQVKSMAMLQLSKAFNEKNIGFD